MPTSYHALRQLKTNPTFKEGDILVLFGELFSRGYANGLVEAAQNRGLKIIRATVGRRDKEILRALSDDELKTIPDQVINIPLEAGFDFEPNEHGQTPIDLMKDAKLSDWESFVIDKSKWQTSQKNGRERFQKNLKQFVAELEHLIPTGSNVLFAHLMAGGVPRAKIIMPLMNRSFKGTGDRYLPSEKFWNSSIGELVAQNFFEVTADTFNHLISETSALRTHLEKNGSTVSYSAYGYHGTEVLMGTNYVWQTYTPYLQGWAKLRLEKWSQEWAAKGVKSCVYNCPEILTNSSSIFDGVEVSLYPLLAALKKESFGSEKTKAIFTKCQQLLKPEFSIEDILNLTDKYLKADIVRKHCIFEQWPQHSARDQMELMLNSSEALRQMHKDPKNLITAVLSEVVFDVCGAIMLNDSAKPESSISWINHDVIAKTYPLI